MILVQYDMFVRRLLHTHVQDRRYSRLPTINVSADYDRRDKSHSSHCVLAKFSKTYSMQKNTQPNWSELCQATWHRSLSLSVTRAQLQTFQICLSARVKTCAWMLVWTSLCLYQTLDYEGDVEGRGPNVYITCYGCSRLVFSCHLEISMDLAADAHSYLDLLLASNHQFQQLCSQVQHSHHQLVYLPYHCITILSMPQGVTKIRIWAELEACKSSNDNACLLVQRSPN